MLKTGAFRGDAKLDSILLQKFPQESTCCSLEERCAELAREFDLELALSLWLSLPLICAWHSCEIHDLLQCGSGSFTTPSAVNWTFNLGGALGNMHRSKSDLHLSQI